MPFGFDRGFSACPSSIWMDQRNASLTLAGTSHEKVTSARNKRGAYNTKACARPAEEPVKHQPGDSIVDRVDRPYKAGRFATE